MPQWTGPELRAASGNRTPDMLITSPSIDCLGRSAVVSTRGCRSPWTDVYSTQLQQPSVSRPCCQIESSTSCFPGPHGRVVGCRPTSAPGRSRTLNPLFQDLTRRLLPISAQNARSPGGTTNGDCRLIPAPFGQVGCFDGSKTEVAAPTRVETVEAAGVPVGADHRNQSLRAVRLTAKSCRPIVGLAPVQVHGDACCGGVVDVSYGCQQRQPGESTTCVLARVINVAGFPRSIMECQ